MLFARLLERVIREGTLVVTDASGHTHRIVGTDQPEVAIRLHDKSLHAKLAIRPELYLGEAYMDGTLTIEQGTIYDFLDLCGRNIRHFENYPLNRVFTRLSRIARDLQQHNPIGHAQRNVAHHYDLSESLYNLFLDNDRQYSCAYFDSGNDSLEVAQEKKKRHLAAKLLLEPGQTVLDIGCGYGFFLRHVKSVVPTVSGVEIDLEAAQYARRRFDLPVSHMPIERYDSKAPLDCMVMCDVLEHLHKPDYALRRCRDMLAPGGIVFLQVPNHVGFRLPRGHSWGLPHHIWQFNPKSLRRLVESCGLIPEDHYTGVLGVIGAYERGGPTMRERVEWLLARKLGLGNRLMMIARKPMNGV